MAEYKTTWATKRRYVDPWLTPTQAQIIIDALDMYTEGSMGQVSKRELREAASARKKIARALANVELGSHDA